MADELTNNQISEIYPQPDFQEMIEVGVFYGRRKTITCPRMKPYVFRTYNNIEIINLGKTKEGLEKALEFLKEIMKNGGMALLVGTQPAAQNEILKISHEFNLPAVVNRWLGGTLTNFKIISGRIIYFKKLKSQLASGELEKYTKKERLDIEQEIKRLEELLGTMENYNSLPDVIIVIDPIVHKTAVNEARRLKIPLIALSNTDANPDLIDYPVVGNTKSRKSINWFLEKIADTLREAKKLAAATAPVPETPSVETKEGISQIGEELAVE